MSVYTLTNIIMADKSTRLLDQALYVLRAAAPPQVVVEQQDTSGERLTVLYRSRAESATPLVALTLRVLPANEDSAGEPHPDIVWVAPTLSPSLKQRFRETGRSFISVQRREVVIVHPALVIDRIAPRPASAVKSASVVDPFRPGVSRIASALLGNALAEKPYHWGIRELAAYTGVDRTTTSAVVNTLADYDLVTRERDPHKRGKGVSVRLRDVRALLERWSTTYDITRNPALAVHAPIGDPRAFLRRLPQALQGTTWALTLHAGASLLAPHASWERVHLYVDVDSDRELAEIARQQGWEAGDGGKLVIMRPWYHHDFRRRIQIVDNLPVVDMPQLLLDLWRYPVRGREQAEHLLRARHARAQDMSSAPA